MITSNALIARITGDALNATITGTGNGLDEQQTNELTFSSKIYRLLHTVLGSENKVYGLRFSTGTILVNYAQLGLPSAKSNLG